MKIVSLALFITGAGFTIYGIIQNNSIEAQIFSMCTTGQANPGTPCIIIGTIALVLGILLFIANFMKSKKAE